jgi:glutamate racemase
MGSTAPIGIFDSGIGGLTVANAISRHLSNEQLIYFGDTAHLPYGDKSIDAIKSYAEKIASYLIGERNCKALVIACNTASSAAYEFLRDKYHGSIPVISVIDPVIEAIVADDSIRHVGLIATKATIASGVYQEKLSRRKPEVKYSALATPLLVPMIEEGFYYNNISRELIHTYLSDTTLQGIDALILGCTHYIIIRNQIHEFYNGRVKLFDSTDIVAAKLKTILYREQLLAEERVGDDEFLVSDFTASFEQTTHLFYQKKVKLTQLNIWNEK